MKLMKSKHVMIVAISASLGASPLRAKAIPQALGQVLSRVTASKLARSGVGTNSSLALAQDATAQASAIALQSRALPSPLTSPPFPFSDWAVNGGSPIGESWDASRGPLQNALFGKGWDSSRVHLYGWIDAGFDRSTSNHSNLPYLYAIQPNRPQLNQAVLRLERLPDTVQVSHLDWGFRVTGLAGIDYRFGLADGYFYDQLKSRNALYGWDIPEASAMLYLPKIGQGAVIQAGRYYSPTNTEGQLAPSNYLYSHSLTGNSDPYTYSGVNLQLRLSSHWSLFAGVHGGDDKSPFSKSAALNGELLAGWQDANNSNFLWGGFDSLGSGKFKNGHDDVQIFSLLWGHKFNEVWHTQTQIYYMWQYDAALGGNEVDGPTEPYAPGGGLGPIIPGQSHTLALVNYLSRKLNSRDALTLRTEFFDDAQGQRTGYANDYTTLTFGLTHYLNANCLIRPEIRFDNASKNAAYDNGTRKTQWTLAGDVIFRF
jgi:hypothetical protein